MLYYPDDLPQYVMQQGFQHTVADGRLVEAMDRGPPKQSVKSSAAIDIVPCQIQVDVDGRARFERFWREGCCKVKPFLIRDQLRDGFRLLDQDGVQLLDQDDNWLLVTSWWLVQFDSNAPSAVSAGGLLFNIAFTLNVLP